MYLPHTVLLLGDTTCRSETLESVVINVLCQRLSSDAHSFMRCGWGCVFCLTVRFGSGGVWERIAPRRRLA